MLSVARIQTLLSHSMPISAAVRALPSVRVVAANVQKRSFNQLTLINAVQYLRDYRDEVRLEKNESGFIRARFPAGIFVPDEKVKALDSGEALRANFWYHESGIGLGDESIHDHPNPFQSYIVNGGYDHAIYELTDSSPITEIMSKDNLSIKEVWELYKEHILFTQSQSEAFQFAIDKASKSVKYVGHVPIRKIAVQRTFPGQVVEIDDQMIHQVCNFRAIPGQKTLSLNIVRNTGKGVTNIFLPENKNASVKTEREQLRDPERGYIVDEMATLLEESARRFSM